MGSIAGDQNKLFTRSIHLTYRSLSLLHAGNQEKAGLRKETGGKNGAVITKKYTARDDGMPNTQGDLEIRVFGLYEWVFVRMILKLVKFFDQIYYVITPIRTLSVALIEANVN